MQTAEIVDTKDLRQSPTFPASMDLPQRRSLAFVCLVATVAGLTIGAVVAFLALRGSAVRLDAMTRNSYEEDDSVTETLLEEVDRQTLFKIMSWLSEEPHLTGQQREADIAEWIDNTLRKMGLDRVSTDTFDALLSYPDQRCPNKVELIDSSLAVIFTTATSPSLDYTSCLVTQPQSERQERRLGTAFRDGPIPPYSAYSPSGVVNGQMVYANLGTKGDFEYLKLTASIDLSGRVAIIRTGVIHAANKVYNAQRAGAIGVVLFSDPLEVAPDGTDQREILTGGGVGLPGDGVVMGHVRIGTGDPTTPEWATLDGAERRVEVTGMPEIPVQTVSYEAARTLLNSLAGPESPSDWKGAIPSTQYRLGGAFVNSGPHSATNKVKLSVYNRLRLAGVTNVFGVIRGAVEPDRYVLVGTHRDAWGPGAADPSAAVAAIMAAAQAFRRAMDSEGWRPRRTVVFAFWGAEVFGAVGSTEWTERHLPKVSGRVVAYLHSDLCVSGPRLTATASPALKKTLLQVAKDVADPMDKDRSYYDFWTQGRSNVDDGPLGWGSGMTTRPAQVTIDDFQQSAGDESPFAFLGGIPTLDLTFGRLSSNGGRGSRNDVDNRSAYPARSTAYDHMDAYERAVDPGLRYLQLCSRVLALTARKVSDEPMLPHDFVGTARALLDGHDRVRNDEAYQELVIRAATDRNVTLDGLEEALEEFNEAAEDWTARAAQIDSQEPMSVRAFNDQILQVNGVLAGAFGAVRKRDIGTAVAFSKILETLDELSEPGMSTEVEEENWEALRGHIFDLVIMIKQAVDLLQEFHHL